MRVLHHLSNPFPLDPMFFGQNFVVGNHTRNTGLETAVASYDQRMEDTEFFNLQRQVAYKRFITKLMRGNFHQVFTEFRSSDSFAQPGFNGEYSRTLKDWLTGERVALAFHYFRDRYSGAQDLKQSSLGKQAALFIHLHCMADVYLDEVIGRTSPHSLRKKELLKRAIGETDPRFIAVSDRVKESFSQLGYIPEERISVVRNGVCESLYKPGTQEDREELRAKTGIRGDQLVGYVGRISPEKGSATIMSLLRYFNKTKDNLGFVIATANGRNLDTFVQEVQKGARKLVEQDRLKLCVDVSKLIAGDYRGDQEVVDFFEQRARKKVPKEMFGGVLTKPVQPCLDVYVQPSRTEGISLSILEALMSGVPVVASNTGGIPEAVNYNNGTLIDISGRKGLEIRDDFKDAIRTQLAKPKSPGYIGEIRQNLLDAGFSAKTMTEKLDKIYRTE